MKLHSFRIRAKLVLAGLGILHKVHDHDDKTGDRNKEQQDERPSLADIMRSANTYRKAGKQDRKTEDDGNNGECTGTCCIL